MLGMHLGDTGRPLRVLAVGAHPDDVEIGAGGTLLELARTRPGLVVDVLVMTGTVERAAEAEAAAGAFLADVEHTVTVHDLPDGRLPARWIEVKDLLEDHARRTGGVDLVLGPSVEDSHQDHRTVAELLPTVFRDALTLGYEIPKSDGDLVRRAVHVPLTGDTAHRKADLLAAHFPSQHGRDWYDRDVFLGLARLRGIECRATHAEAFSCARSVLELGPRP